MQTIRTNLKNSASTQYTNFNYTSMCRFNGVLLGAGQGGLFKACCGTDDNGTKIDAYFILPLTDLAVSGLKRLWYTIIGLICDGSITCDVTYDGYTAGTQLTLTPKTVHRQGIKKLFKNKSTKHSYMQMKISNVNGKYFSIDTISVASVSASQSGN